MLPKQSVDISSTKHGTKLSKARITVFQCLNATGTNVLTPLIIGKAKQPRCFIDNQLKYGDYGNSSSAFMTQRIFNNWMNQLNNKLIEQNKKIILILGNVSSHTTDIEYSSIQLQLLAPNTYIMLH